MRRSYTRSLTLANPGQYTAEAFHTRTGLFNCSAISFKDIAEGLRPPLPLSSVQSSEISGVVPFSTDDVLEMTICSFALHLIESPSELFALLWELRYASNSRLTVRKLHC